MIATTAPGDKSNMIVTTSPSRHLDAHDRGLCSGGLRARHGGAVHRHR
jgi:hypothetical protein